MTQAEHTKLVAAILLEFGARDDMRIWKANCGAAVSKHGALIRFGVVGQADISGIYRDGRRIEIECKTGRGAQKKGQPEWQAMIRKFNGIYCLARSVEDVRRMLGSSMQNGTAATRADS